MPSGPGDLSFFKDFKILFYIIAEDLYINYIGEGTFACVDSLKMICLNGAIWPPQPGDRVSLLCPFTKAFICDNQCFGLVVLIPLYTQLNFLRTEPIMDFKYVSKRCL